MVGPVIMAGVLQDGAQKVGTLEALLIVKMLILYREDNIKIRR